MLLSASLLTAACSGSDDGVEEESFSSSGEGVFVLCEGNFNAGNATLSYYDPATKKVENGVFQRANGRKLGDTGVHFVSDSKAYVTDLYSPYINIIHPKTFTWTGAIATGQAESRGYCSTEEMVQVGKYVYTNCWSYSNKLLAIDTETDEMVREITLSSWQPKSMKADKNGKLWVITDGGYSTEDDSFSDNIPHLYRIDAETGVVEMDQALDSDEANVQIEMNNTKDVLYIINNDIYKMNITASHLPVRPFIEAPKDTKGRRHKLYGIGVNPRNGDIYVGDAVDYSQAGVVYRYDANGTLIDQFRVGINPNHFAFK